MKFGQQARDAYARETEFQYNGQQRVAKTPY